MPTTQTLTNALARKSPRAAHTGMQVITQSFQYNNVTGSLSDTYLMVKVPRHSVILDWYLKGNGGATSTTYRLGFQGGTGSELSSSIVLAATDTINRAGGDTATDALPLTVTVSDDAVDPFKIIALTINSTPSATATGSFTLAVFYAMEGAYD